MTSLLIFGYFAVSLGFFLYSYGFVDFNLTLSSHPYITNFIAWTQKLAMFNRPDSTMVYLVLIGLLFALYGVALVMCQRKLFPWKLVIIFSVIFALSYPFLSSDVFKYLFIGKIIAYYHQNPYLLPPDQFVGDLWLRFMRWVHTTTPYGPVFTALSVPYYLLGFGKFVPILYFYKLDQVAWYLLSIGLIGKLSKANSVKNQLYFAANPLVIVEWLINAHNDAIMLTLLLLSIYLVKQNKKVLSLFALLLSVGIKYVTIVYLPLIIFGKKISSKLTYLILLFIFTLAPLLYHYSYQYQPWYVTWLIPFAALLNIPIISWTVTAYSLGALLRYLSYIGTGLWEGTPLYFAQLTFLPPIITLFVILGLWLVKKSKNQL